MNLNITQAVAYLRAMGQTQLADIVAAGGPLALQVCAKLNSDNGASPMALPALGAAGAAALNGGKGGCGCGCNGSGACGISGGCGTSPNTADSCGVNGVPNPTTGTAIPNSTCPVPPSAIPVCAQVGSWNCQAVGLDLAPCDIAKIQREEKLVTISNATIDGPIPAGETVYALLAPVDVSHDLCIDYLKVEIVTEGVATPVAIDVIEMQAERIYTTGNGEYVHAWDFGDPERPTYLGITDGRCQCFTLCNCTTAQGHLRLQFPLPVEVPAGSSLRVTIWGRRCSWQKSCGPCPPCLLCDRQELTATELASTSNTVYVIT